MMAKIIERAGLAIVAGAALLAPAFKFEDAGIYFNHANNVLSPDIVFIYGGYVVLIPQVTAFAVHGLPPVVQIFLYRLVPLVVLYVLYRELKKLFRLACSELDAVCIAMACLFYFCYFENWVLAVLTWVTWPALFAALVYAVRVQISGERYSFPGAAGLLAAALSHPGGLLLTPILVYKAVRESGLNRRYAGLGLALVIMTWYAVWLRRVPTDELSATHPFAVILHGLFNVTRGDVFAAATALALCIGCAVFFLAKDWAAFRPSLGLSYIGLSTVALYFISERVSRYGGFPIPTRYVLILNVAAVGVVGLLVARRLRPDARRLSVDVLLGFCLALLVRGVIEPGRQPVLEFVDMVRFMNAGSEYRSHCGPGDDAFAYVADEWSPVFVCQKAEFSQGTTSLTKVKYWTVRSFGVDELPLGITHQHVEGVSADTVRKVLEKMR